MDILLVVKQKAFKQNECKISEEQLLVVTHGRSVEGLLELFLMRDQRHTTLCQGSLMVLLRCLFQSPQVLSRPLVL